MAVLYNKERLSESRRVSLNKWRGWGLDASPNDCHDGIGYNILCLCLLYSTAARRTEKRENSRCSGNDPICYLDDVPLSSTAYRYNIYIPPCFSHRSHIHTIRGKRGKEKKKKNHNSKSLRILSLSLSTFFFCLSLPPPTPHWWGGSAT